MFYIDKCLSGLNETMNVQLMFDGSDGYNEDNTTLYILHSTLEITMLTSQSFDTDHTPLEFMSWHIEDKKYRKLFQLIDKQFFVGFTISV